MAPRARPKPRANETPTLPVPRCRSTTASFARSRDGSGDRGAVHDARASSVDEPVASEPGWTSMTRTRAPGGAGEAEARGVEAVEAEGRALGDAARRDVDEERSPLRDAPAAEDDEVGADVLERART